VLIVLLRITCSRRSRLHVCITLITMHVLPYRVHALQELVGEFEGGLEAEAPPAASEKVVQRSSQQIHHLRRHCKNHTPHAENSVNFRRTKRGEENDNTKREGWGYDIVLQVALKHYLVSTQRNHKNEMKARACEIYFFLNAGRCEKTPHRLRKQREMPPLGGAQGWLLK